MVSSEDRLFFCELRLAIGSSTSSGCVMSFVLVLVLCVCFIGMEMGEMRMLGVEGVWGVKVLGRAVNNNPSFGLTARVCVYFC